MITCVNRKLSPPKTRNPTATGNDLEGLPETTDQEQSIPQNKELSPEEMRAKTPQTHPLCLDHLFLLIVTNPQTVSLP